MSEKKKDGGVDTPVHQASEPWNADDAVFGALLEVRGVKSRVPERACPEQGRRVEGRGNQVPPVLDRPFDKLREAVEDTSRIQGLAALAPSADRHHAKSHRSATRKVNREGVLLALGGLVLAAVGLMLGFEVFGGGKQGGDPVANGVAVTEEMGEGTGSLQDGHPDAEPSKASGSLASSYAISMREFDAERLSKDIRELKVQGHGVTDESLAAIAEACPDLEGLTLYDTDITDKGFANYIGKLKKLKRLSLSHSRRITDDGIRALLSVSVGPYGSDEESKPRDLTVPEIPYPTLPLLEELDLTGFVGQTSMGPGGLPEGYVDPYSKLTDACCATISSYPTLKRITLFGTGITHKGLQVLLDAQGDDAELDVNPQHIEWLDVGHTKIHLDRFYFQKIKEPRVLKGISLNNIPVGTRTSLTWCRFVYTTLAKHFPDLEVFSFGGNGFTPLVIEPVQLAELAKLKKLKEVRFSWIAIPEKMDWSPLGELTQLESLTLDSIRGEGNGTILEAVSQLTNLKRLELTNIANLAPMTRKPMDASEYASDNPVRQLRTLLELKHLDFTRSSHILDTALHFLQRDLRDCRIRAADGSENHRPVKVALDAGRPNREGGAAVVMIDKDGSVLAVGRERKIAFNDVTSLFPKDGFRLTSGVRPPVELYQPCYDFTLASLFSHDVRLLGILPSSPASWRDASPFSIDVTYSTVGPPEGYMDNRLSFAEFLLSLPAYDMKRWPKKEIWGTVKPDFRVTVNSDQQKGIAAAVAISQGPIKDWVLKGPGNTGDDYIGPAVMAVLQPRPDFNGDEGQFTHYAEVAIPDGKYWIIVMAPGYKPIQREVSIGEGYPRGLAIGLSMIDNTSGKTPAKSDD